MVSFRLRGSANDGSRKGFIFSSERNRRKEGRKEEKKIGRKYPNSTELRD